MNKIIRVITILLIMIVFACGNVEEEGSDAPIIQDVTIMENINGADSLVIIATDYNFDMTELFILQFFPFDADIPYSGPDVIVLPPQTSLTMTYDLLNCFKIVVPTDNWRIEFQIIDNDNHISNIYSKGMNPAWDTN